MIDVTIIPILNDNYSYLIKSAGKTAIIDPGEAKPVIDYLEEHDLHLDYILNTHHHGDHISGNAALKDKYGAIIAGPKSESHKIAALDQHLTEADQFIFGDESAQIIETPGHTLGHICFYFAESKILFSGDTLFSMGCGRLFEGTPEQMWDSLEKINALPDETMIYCGHEYTASNGAFCLTQEPDNHALKERMAQVKALRANNEPTVPVSLATEKETNVFLRAKNATHFAELRSLKDNS